MSLAERKAFGKSDTHISQRVVDRREDLPADSNDDVAKLAPFVDRLEEVSDQAQAESWRVEVSAAKVRCMELLPEAAQDMTKLESCCSPVICCPTANGSALVAID